MILTRFLPCIFALLLIACGHKDALYLPDEPQAKSETSPQQQANIEQELMTVKE